MKTIRVAVSDDHPVVLAGVARWVELADGLELVGAAENPEIMKEICVSQKPDVAVVDLMYLGSECVELVNEIKRISPETKIIIYSAFTEARQVMAAIECGADGYLSKEPSDVELSMVIREVYQNNTYLDPCITQMVDPGHGRHQNSSSSSSTSAPSSSFKERGAMIEFVRRWYRQMLERDAIRMMEFLTDKERQILLKRLEANTDIEAAYAIGLGEADYKNRMSTIRRKLQMPKKQILNFAEIFRNIAMENPEKI